MHSNKKMMTLFVMFSLFIATLFLIPQTQNEAHAAANVATQNVQIKHKKSRKVRKAKRAKKHVRKARKVRKHAKKRVKRVRVVRHVRRAHRSSAARRAKAWIAARESGGSYSARNGSCFGKYQLLISYYGGNYSHKNQERVANRYVHSRYGSWVNAKAFWSTHHWY
ncbi:hypothetical protein [Apilactobacillus bombintestini]|uniref:Aggregation promoting factor n=1 Tax=Apilactobacillus bombintestini TaxID=2419772 RepID=A0A387AND8_9LACO|nr:hypothetical protein D7I45_01145 [Apilactobacillus bombintestini]